MPAAYITIGVLAGILLCIIAAGVVAVKGTRSKSKDNVQEAFNEYVFLCSLVNEGRIPSSDLITKAFVDWHGLENLVHNHLKERHPPVLKVNVLTPLAGPIPEA